MPHWPLFITPLTPLVKNSTETIQEGLPLRDGDASLANSFYFVEPIGYKLKKTIKRDNLCGPYLPYWPIFISQFTLFLVKINK